MPELPEVETIARGLRRSLVGRTIARGVCYCPKIAADNEERWLAAIEEKKLTGVRRRGKNLLLDLSGGLTLWVHLKMTGHLYLRASDEPVETHDRLIFYLKGRPDQLRFHDMRRFGRVRLFPTAQIMNQQGLCDLGPDALELGQKAFVDLLNAHARLIKPALLDQRFLAGLGNIYADESLFSARIHPRRLTHSLSAAKLSRLHEAIGEILQEAIGKMGSSVDNYAGVDGRPGGYQSFLRVYGREGADCPRCGDRIKRERIGSRSAHYCPRCQRLY